VIIEYINEALKKAKYEIINDEDPYYGEIPEIKGVWATGKTLEECRQQLRETLDEWLILSFKKNLPIPDINGIDLNLKLSAKIATDLSQGFYFKNEEVRSHRSFFLG
jgi:predicted RNase H-like HicB family nuclease